MNAKEKLKKLRAEMQKTLVIHYSCENLSDNNDGYSPRITSIAVQRVDSETMHSFSIHLVAEHNKIDREDIERNYDDLEAKMLNEFYKFVEQYKSFNWLHWNMKNVSYGFEALEHRYRILTKEEVTLPRVPDVNRFNLSSLLLGFYGENCVSESGRMGQFMQLNGGYPKNFLGGEDEVEAFRNKEYVKMHASTLCKVETFKRLFLLLLDNRIKTQLDNKIKTQRSNLPREINRAIESLPVKILGFIAIVVTLLTGAEYLHTKLEPGQAFVEQKEMPQSDESLEKKAPH